MSRAVIAIRIHCTNDRNGNPRRGWLIIDPSNGCALDFCDEGYNGRSAFSVPYPDALETITIHVAPTEYRAFRRMSLKQARS